MHKTARDIYWYNISEERGVLDFLIRFSLKVPNFNPHVVKLNISHIAVHFLPIQIISI